MSRKVLVTLDSAGGVAIPKALREELHMAAGDALEVESVGGQIILRSIRGTAPLMQEQGVWVFHSGEPLPASATDELVEQTRQERDASNVGEGK